MIAWLALIVAVICLIIILNPEKAPIEQTFWHGD